MGAGARQECVLRSGVEKHNPLHGHGNTVQTLNSIRKRGSPVEAEASMTCSKPALCMVALALSAFMAGFGGHGAVAASLHCYEPKGAERQAILSVENKSVTADLRQPVSLVLTKIPRLPGG